ncbi:unnamed protein product [Amaranthus hypochondriacus]
MASQGTISHHEHPLYEFDHKCQYKCNGCEMDGFGKRFRCGKCNFDLHPECKLAEPIKIYEKGTYEFFAKPPIGVNCSNKHKCKSGYCRSCDACGMTLKGYMYHSTYNDQDFHPKCLKLELKIKIEDVIFTLQHQMPRSFKCAMCKKNLVQGAVKKTPGWSYVSEYDDCDFHVYCVMEMAMKSMNCSSTSRQMNSSAVERYQHRKIKKKGSSSIRSKSYWFKIISAFMTSVISILIGDPTTFVASTMVHLITQSVSN